MLRGIDELGSHDFESVSYTHLDVYKRQTLIVIAIQMWFAI